MIENRSLFKEIFEFVDKGIEIKLYTGRSMFKLFFLGLAVLSSCKPNTNSDDQSETEAIYTSSESSDGKRSEFRAAAFVRKKQSKTRTPYNLLIECVQENSLMLNRSLSQAQYAFEKVDLEISLEAINQYDKALEGIGCRLLLRAAVSDGVIQQLFEINFFTPKVFPKWMCSLYEKAQSFDKCDGLEYLVFANKLHVDEKRHEQETCDYYRNIKRLLEYLPKEPVGEPKKWTIPAHCN